MDFSGVTVLVVGDVMLDRFVEGEIERISPEAPVPVLRLLRTREMPGGAANVASNIASLGGAAILIGLVGRDDAAGALGRLVTGGRITGALVASDTRPTVCKTRFIASRQQVVRTDEESTAPVTAIEEGAILRAVDANLGRVDVVILSDYAKGVLSSSVLTHTITAARAAGVPVFVDPKGERFERYRGATCITPNQRELGRAAAVTLPDAADAASVIAACRQLIERSGCDAILATRSERGMILVERDGEATTVRARAREVFDVSGAGDTVIAALALAHAAGRTLPQAMRVANAAAGVVVSKFGTATASIAEVTHELGAADAPPGPAARLQSPERLAELVGHWKAQGLSVGFTNGCFDILHAGHVALIAAASEACDRLVVALNTDASVGRLKGSARPINPLASRAAVVAALRDVDAVAAFDADTPLALIASVRPDVLIKGADYAIDQVVGADLVLAQGGRVVLADLVPEHSTSAIIARGRR